MKLTQRQIAGVIHDGINAVVYSGFTNFTYKLDDRLAIMVGWSAGYGEEKRTDIIQAEDQPDYGLNVGLKVWTSDYMQTDFDMINFPYTKDGEVLDYSLSVEPCDIKNGCKDLARTISKWYKEMQTVALDKTGLILKEE